jgi:hypothetical protein
MMAGLLKLSMYLSRNTPKTAPGIVATTTNQNNLPLVDLGLVNPALINFIQSFQKNNITAAAVPRCRGNIKRNIRDSPFKQPWNNN